MKVYPRVGGGTGYPRDFDLHADGLSPRGRGNPGSDFLLDYSNGSIPAWAGEPNEVFTL